MDLNKQLAKFSKKEIKRILGVVESINKGDLFGLQLKKLSGKKDLFRIRVGSIRVLYRRIGKKALILKIERRSDKTYRNL